MATVTPPSPTLSLATLSSIIRVDRKAGASVASTWAALTQGLSGRAAGQLPAAIGGVLPLLEADRELLLLATDLCVALDLFEAAPALTSLAGRSRNAHLALSAASFARHPGVSPEVGAAILDLAERVPLSARELRAFNIRVDASLTPLDDLERDLRARSWPGSDGGSPFALIDIGGAPPQVEQALLARLVAAQITVRRVPGRLLQTPDKTWIPAKAPLIYWDDSARTRFRQILGSAPSNELRAPARVAEIDRYLAALQARTPGSSAGLSPVLTSGLHPFELERDLMLLGSLDFRDMAFLGGGSHAQLYHLGKRQALVPRYVGGDGRSAFWTFSQLIAFRTWRYFAALSGRARFPATLVGKLENLAEQTRPSEVGLTSQGHLLRREDQVWVDFDTRQQVIEPVVVAADRLFRPFTLGAGNVPDLITPSRHTRTHPAVLGGTPFITHSRVSARALAEVDRSAGREALRDAYPDLQDDVVDDAVAVGLQLLEVK